MIALSLLAAVSLITVAPTSISAMKWQKRVLVISAPDANDRLLLEQRRIIARWRLGAEERDLAVVEVVGDDVVGASDPASLLRLSFRLPTVGFAVVLVGKDGGAKLKENRPISAAFLEATIDAMPMRHGDKR